MQPPQPSEQNLVTLYDDLTQLQSKRLIIHTQLHNPGHQIIKVIIRIAPWDFR